MSALNIVTQYLLAQSTVTARVGQRIFDTEAPGKTAAPYIVIDLIAEPDEQILDGAGGYYESRVQITVLAAGTNERNAVAEIVKASLESVVKASIAGCTDVDIRKADSDVTGKNDGQSLFGRATDYYVRWR